MTNISLLKCHTDMLVQNVSVLITKIEESRLANETENRIGAIIGMAINVIVCLVGIVVCLSCIKCSQGRIIRVLQARTENLLGRLDDVRSVMEGWDRIKLIF